MASLGRGGYHLQNMEYRRASFEKQIITVFEPMYLEILNNYMVGFSNTTARDMIEHIFLY
jgi:hypothetical protein